MFTWSFCHFPAPPHLRYARPRKRLAARGFARARRAVGGIACEPASALGPASAMRCIAATRLGNPLRGTRKPHGKGLERSLDFQASSLPGTFQKFSVPPNGGIPNPARRGKPRQGLGQGAVGGRGTCSPGRRRGRAPSRHRRLLAQPVSQGRAKRPAPRPLLLCFSASPLLCVKEQPRTSPSRILIWRDCFPTSTLHALHALHVLAYNLAKLSSSTFPCAARAAGYTAITAGEWGRGGCVCGGTD
jgi:hypothetical protein